MTTEGWSKHRSRIQIFIFFLISVMPRGFSYYIMWWLLLAQDDQWGPCRMLFGAAVINCQTFVFSDNCTVAPQSMETWRHPWNKKSPLQRKGETFCYPLSNIFNHHHAIDQRPGQCVFRTLELTQTPGGGWCVCFFELKAENNYLNCNLQCYHTSLSTIWYLVGWIQGSHLSLTHISNLLKRALCPQILCSGRGEPAKLICSFLSCLWSFLW